MLDLAAVLDSDRVQGPSYWQFLRELGALLGRRAEPPAPEELPDGQGRMVLVVPPLLGSDGFTGHFRRFLGRCGFQAHGWGLGVNWGPTPAVLAGLEARFDALHAAHGPLALVGISMGGLLARNLAAERPGAVTHLVTLGSPVRLPTATSIAPFIRLCARRYSGDIRLDRLRAPLPMPCTAIYTKDDGIVAPESCFLPDAEAVEVGGPHMRLPSNPAALRAVVRRLAG